MLTICRYRGCNSRNSHRRRPDAELIRICQEFAEAELRNWYLETLNPDAEIEPTNRNIRELIARTLAETPEGLHAKMLALSCWDSVTYANEESGGEDTLLSSIMRDMVAPARNAIVAKLAVGHCRRPALRRVDGWDPCAPRCREAKH